MRELIAALAGNAGLLLAMAVLYDALGFRGGRQPPIRRELGNGFLLGTIGVAVMLFSFQLAPGVVFDTRSVVLSLGGLFFGAIPALGAGVITGTFRLAMGGPGTAMGVAVILVSVAIGVAWRYVRRPRLEALSLGELYIFGIVVHLGMLACTVFLPRAIRLTTLMTIVAPVLVIYPIVTALGGWVLRSGHERRLGDQARKRVTEILESMTDGFIALDRDWHVTYVNANGAELFGRKPAELLGKRIWAELPADAVQHFRRHYEEAMREGKPVFFEHYHAPWDRWFENRVFPSPNGLSIFFHEITDSKRAEEAASRLNEAVARQAKELEARVAERTRELEQRTAEAERLNRAMLNLLEDLKAEQRHTREITRRLEISNRELETFAYSVSHDLRAPLRAIDGFSEALAEELGSGLNERQKDSLDRIRAAAQRMGGMIDDLLKLSRATRVEMRRQRVDLSELAHAVLDELREGDPGRPVEIEVPPGLTAEGDPQLLRLVLQNLIGNAWKFTAPRPRARIELGRLEGGIFYVRDNGVGFDMKYADKLFGAFQRLHRQEEFPGTGIGLATVQRIVLRHGGRVWAEAEPGRGATFFFSLGEVGGG
ncbi:MAG: PAS domain-containing protein [Acidobacteria bacterium]|nr:PAS domain-containing protein [Acidobacteriota bacterium]